ncbi:MAG: choice-of-anchor I family protein [Spirochaetes bacterium]|nr:choice-of-anchor I family protein [Spirochaetota bacterium]
MMRKMCLLLIPIVLMMACKSSPKTQSKQDQKQTIHLSKISTYETGLYDESGAEIVSYHKGSKRLFFVNAHASAVAILDIADPINPQKIKEVTFEGGDANSVAINGEVIAVAVEDSNKQANGKVYFIDSNGNQLANVEVGALPDMVTISPDGKYVLSANEGEPSDDYANDPDGTVSIIDISKGINQNLTATTIRLTEADSNRKIRITGPEGTSFSQDVEPEYIAVTDDSKFAYVCLQENNAIAKIDIPAKKVLTIQSLGAKDHSLAGNGLDAGKDKVINIKNYPVFGLYMPDAIDSYQVKGKSYVITANEGDSREYDDYEDEEQVSKIILDPDAFSNASELQAEIGDLKVVSTEGDWDNDGDYDQIYTFGTRSFSIWDENINLVFDSGDQFEQITAQMYPEYFNTSNDEDKIDGRSKSKGPEPEGITVGMVAKQYYAFILLERIGGIMVYNITNPQMPEYVEYINTRNFGALADKELTEVKGEAGDLGPEGVIFISESDSPIGQPLLVVANEVSGTVTIFKVESI